MIKKPSPNLLSLHQKTDITHLPIPISPLKNESKRMNWKKIYLLSTIDRRSDTKVEGGVETEGNLREKKSERTEDPLYPPKTNRVFWFT